MAQAKQAKARINFFILTIINYKSDYGETFLYELISPPPPNILRTLSNKGIYNFSFEAFLVRLGCILFYVCFRFF